jgi:hypothetical protein
LRPAQANSFQDLIFKVIEQNGLEVWFKWESVCFALKCKSPEIIPQFRQKRRKRRRRGRKRKEERKKCERRKERGGTRDLSELQKDPGGLGLRGGLSSPVVMWPSAAFLSFSC